MTHLLRALMVVGAMTTACVAPPRTLEDATHPPQPALKMRHQILFSTKKDDHVFEGYMLLSGDTFLVTAFAGPGVDLFTIARSGSRETAFLHISSLADRIDIEKVAADIKRTYLPGCAASVQTPSGAAGRRTCDFFGEPLVESTGEDGRLLSREFPAAHDIGLTVTYEDYITLEGYLVPRQITLRWGASENRMVIRLIALEALAALPRNKIERVLPQ